VPDMTRLRWRSYTHWAIQFTNELVDAFYAYLMMPRSLLAMKSAR
jgi:hypothetical protein